MAYGEHADRNHLGYTCLMIPDLASRLEALEIHVAHQDAAIDDLNATITAQWRKIDALIREVAGLGDRLQDLGQREPGRLEPAPPHY